ncbi:glycosyltransferase family 2 protein [Zavarzinia sp. CC-PAN008]|uniref:glycosyltransferase family 2 protein n=1 Tax=Zavarzinia sp. CC-PAN008 TaxID=3243332 RepID=UPI003F74A037
MAQGGGSDPASIPMVSVIIPTLNEARHVEACVESIARTAHPTSRYEILVVDGGSTDGTQDIVRRMSARLPQVRLLDNPDRLQAAAFNKAILNCDPATTYFIRADAHSIFPDEFVGRCIAAIERHGADLVVFYLVPIETGPWFRRAVSMGFRSVLGVGDSSYRRPGPTQPVDHGYHGCFRRSLFARVEPYDPAFSHNEDGELSYRIGKAGGLIILDSTIQVNYVPRATLRTLARQYLLYGRGRVRMLLKHRLAPRWRQLLPPALVALEGVTAATGIAALLGAPLGGVLKLLAIPLVAYGLLMLGSAVPALARTRDSAALALPLVLATMHHAWGYGFLDGLWRARGQKVAAPAAHAAGSGGPSQR